MVPLVAVIMYCAPITAAAPGCRFERVNVVERISQPACTMKAQELAAERIKLHPGERIVRLGCERRRV